MAAPGPKTFDLLILGAEPAAASAAIRARQLELSVGLLTPGGGVTDELDWLSPPGVALCGELGLKAAACGATVWSGLTLHSWDLQRHIAVKDAALSGWLVPRRKFHEALLKAAVAAGAQRRNITGFELAIQDEFVTAGSAPAWQGKLGLIADEKAADAAAKLNTRILARPPPSTAAVTIETPPPGKGVTLHMIPPALRDGPIAVWRSDGKRARLTLFSRSGTEHATRELEKLLANAVREKLLAALPRGKPEISSLPAGDALEIESHVTKGLLLCGAAGGFVAAASTEHLNASLRSGLIAAETAQRALKSAVPQDELARFDAAWRGVLADCIRALHTDLSLLTPLLFTNEQMALRLARALLLGQPF